MSKRLYVSWVLSVAAVISLLCLWLTAIVGLLYFYKPGNYHYVFVEGMVAAVIIVFLALPGLFSVWNTLASSVVRHRSSSIENGLPYLGGNFVCGFERLRMIFPVSFISFDTSSTLDEGPITISNSKILGHELRRVWLFWLAVWFLLSLGIPVDRRLSPESPIGARVVIALCVPPVYMLTAFICYLLIRRALDQNRHSAI